MIDINRIRSNINNYYKQKKEEHYKEHTRKRNEMWLKYYGSTQWKELRNNYYQQHPLCECHEKLGIVVPGEEVHHLKKWSSGITEEAKWKLLLSPQNLCCLCNSCHKLAHKIMNEQGKDYISLDELVNKRYTLNNV